MRIVPIAPWVAYIVDSANNHVATVKIEHEPAEPILERRESWRWRVELTEGGGGGGPLA